MSTSESNDLLEHLAIALPIQRYARACDEQDFALFDTIFTPEAVLDYSSAGGPTGDRGAIAEWLRKSRDRMVQWQHILSPSMIEFRDGSATARTDAYAPCFFGFRRGPSFALHTGARYHDKLTKRADGWWIAERRFEATWSSPGIGFGAGSRGN